MGAAGGMLLLSLVEHLPGAGKGGEGAELGGGKAACGRIRLMREVEM